MGGTRSRGGLFSIKGYDIDTLTRRKTAKTAKREVTLMEAEILGEERKKKEGKRARAGKSVQE